MRRLLFVISLIVLLGMAAPVCYAAKTDPVKKEIPAVLKMDTAKLAAQHSFSPDKLKKYLDDPDYHYNKEDVAGETLWTRFWRWFWRTVNHKLFPDEKSSTLFFYLEVLIGVGFLIFLVNKVTGINVVSVFRGRAKEIPLVYSELTEDINEINFEAEIEKAISSGNYRLAVRLLYLYSLKQLNDVGIIAWEAGKTNMAYLGEMPDGERKQLFRVLTRQFEYVWYGDFKVDNHSFAEINSLFKQFKQQLR